MAFEIVNITPPTAIATLKPIDAELVITSVTPTQFSPNDPSHYIEYTITSVGGNNAYSITTFNYEDYTLNNISSPNDDGSIIQEIDLDPVLDLESRGFTQGNYNTIYNFFKLELDSSNTNPNYFIKEISSDRLEIKVASLSMSNEALALMVNAFKQKLYLPGGNFQLFYLNFGSNNIVTANNITIDTSKPKYEILINLYNALPNQIEEKTTLWFTTALADTLGFSISFTPTPLPTTTFLGNKIKGPNFDLSIKNKINNSSNYLDYSTLLTTGLSTSYNKILSYLEDSGLNISVDYSDFNNFIHFSSAQQRIQNFYYKVQLIEQYNASILDLELTNSSSLDTDISLIQDQVTNVIKNFDGFEYYLYFNTGSNTYPKGTSVPPYDPMSSVSAEVLAWYDEQITLAADYDQNNKDNLINTIPAYISEDTQNAPYNTFVNMIG